MIVVMNIHNLIYCGKFSTVYQGRNSIELRGTFFEYREPNSAMLIIVMRSDSFFF